jgi:hypothetical protein
LSKSLLEIFVTGGLNVLDWMGALASTGLYLKLNTMASVLANTTLMALVSPGLTHLVQKPVHKCAVGWRQLLARRAISLRRLFMDRQPSVVTKLV